MAIRAPDGANNIEENLVNVDNVDVKLHDLSRHM